MKVGNMHEVRSWLKQNPEAAKNLRTIEKRLGIQPLEEQVKMEMALPPAEREALRKKRQALLKQLEARK
jgi:hypothetical protein